MGRGKAERGGQGRYACLPTYLPLQPEPCPPPPSPSTLPQSPASHARYPEASAPCGRWLASWGRGMGARGDARGWSRGAVRQAGGRAGRRVGRWCGGQAGVVGRWPGMHACRLRIPLACLCRSVLGACVFRLQADNCIGKCKPMLCTCASTRTSTPHHTSTPLLMPASTHFPTRYAPTRTATHTHPWPTPPPLLAVRGWLWGAMSTSDLELLQSSGLDALVRMGWGGCGGEGRQGRLGLRGGGSFSGSLPHRGVRGSL